MRYWPSVAMLVLLSSLAGAGGFGPARADNIAAGGDHTCALIGSGALSGHVKCWGRNVDGELGDGTNTGRNTPVLVKQLSGVISIAAGLKHTCAVLNTGRVKCWGQNVFGQLGDGTTTNRNTPVFAKLVAGAIAVSASGVGHTCAIVAGGRAKCWGRNSENQLGDGTTTERHSPVFVLHLTGGTAIAAGGYHTCAMTGAGQVECWGANGYGQMGDGTDVTRSAPVVVSAISGAISIAAGIGHNCAILGNGRGQCWGYNVTGQIGDSTITDRFTPVFVKQLSGATAIAGDDRQLSGSTCALISGGHAKCWGANGFGQLGDGTIIERDTPVAVKQLVGATAITEGDGHACASTSTGQVKCWGYGFFGQLGNGANIDQHTPVLVQGLTGVAAPSKAGQ